LAAASLRIDMVPPSAGYRPIWSRTRRQSSWPSPTFYTAHTQGIGRHRTHAQRKPPFRHLWVTTPTHRRSLVVDMRRVGRGRRRRLLETFAGSGTLNITTRRPTFRLAAGKGPYPTWVRRARLTGTGPGTLLALTTRAGSGHHPQAGNTFQQSSPSAIIHGRRRPARAPTSPAMLAPEAPSPCHAT